MACPWHGACPSPCPSPSRSRGWASAPCPPQAPGTCGDTVRRDGVLFPQNEKEGGDPPRVPWHAKPWPLPLVPRCMGVPGEDDPPVPGIGPSGKRYPRTNREEKPQKNKGTRDELGRFLTTAADQTRHSLPGFFLPTPAPPHPWVSRQKKP